jgi:hypothetical protein
MALTELQQLADGASRSLRWAEVNEDWSLMESLLGTLKALGGHVIRIGDPRFNWRADYVVEFRKPSSAPALPDSPSKG